MGGRMVFALMKYYPQRFSAFIIGGRHPFSGSDLANTLQQWLKKGMLYVVEQIETNFSPFPANMRERYLKNNVQAMLAAYPSIYREDLSSSLSQIDVPVLLYAGSKDSVVDQMQQTQPLLKNSQLELLADCDHAQAYWRGDVASQLIRNFIKKNFS